MSGENKEKKGSAFLIIGVALLFLGLLADVLGLGASSAFGYKQIAACIIGVVLITLGATKCKSCKPKDGSQPSAP